MNTLQLIDLYKLYGFDLEEETANYLVFTYTNGYFNNAEIVNVSNVQLDECKEKYEELGFSVSVIDREELPNIHSKLFSGFFSLKNAKRKSLKEYDDFCQSQKNKLACEHYEYLNCDYVIDSVLYENGLTDLVFQKMNGDSAQLIIIEAAAGYGKTCTSYEILHKFAVEDNEKVPMITELSRNRKAAIFKYVLLTEIDRNFSTLSAKVVEHEIREGNVPLIVDGFDELLSKSIEYDKDIDGTFEEAQSMLDTISQLLTNNSKAKIIITSRKSAIFAGEKFDEWLENRELSCGITRIELQPPKVKNWLGHDKTKVLEEKNIKLEYLANPILLSLLRERDVDYIKNHSVKEIVHDYFLSILEREKERQSLPLEPHEQLDILGKLSADFALFNISSEEGDFVKDLIADIINENVTEYIKRYEKYSFDSVENIPSEEEFIMKLLHHALLDRTIPGKNQIGFVNDFVFGVLLGAALVNHYIEKPHELDYKYLELMCGAYSIDGIDEDNIVATEIEKISVNYSVSQQMQISNKLFHCNNKEYKDATISNISFTNGFEFLPDNTIRNCTFVNCIFDNCVFYNTSFYECHFYNCVFFEPQIISSSNCKLLFLGCTGYEKIAEKFAEKENVSNLEDVQNFEKIILEQFWKKGSDSLEPRRGFLTMHKGIASKDINNADKALKSLLQKGILRKLNICYELDFSKMSEIMQILGRDTK